MVSREYELFLALAAPRLDAAEQALGDDDDEARARGVAAALVPLAVDAALLGADGLARVAQAAARRSAPREVVLRALAELGRAATELSHGDASGARVNESALLALAAELDQGRVAGEATVAPSAHAATGDGDGDGDGDESHWSPQIAEDMVTAFLDECAERLEGLAEKLLVLEERGTDAELVNALFRDLHTLKGSSAFAGLKKLNRVAHRAEDLIGELREGKRQVDRPLVDVLLASLDVLRAIVDKARARAPIDVSVDALLARLADPRAAVALPTVSASAPGQAAAAAPGAAQSTLRIEFEKVDLLLNLVGEIVLARGRLTGASEAQGGLLREVTALRKRLGHGQPTDADTAEDLALELQRTERVLRESWGDLDGALGGLGLALGQLRDQVMKLRMVPIARLFTKFQRTVRELAQRLGKEVRVELVGGETELDKVLVERLDDPLLHLVRNAVDHGVEAPDVRERAGKPRVGTLRLGAAQRGGQIIVSIVDDGGGMDPARLRDKAQEKGLIDAVEAAALSDADALQLIFRAGFSTAATVSDVSGRGVGMDVVRDAIEKLKGNIHLESRLGAGTSLELRLPLTLAITGVLAARVGAEHVAIPLDAVVSAQHVAPGDLEVVGGSECLRVGDALIPVVRLAEQLGLPATHHIGEAEGEAVVVVDVGASRLGLAVQQVLGRHEVVVKSLGPLLARAPCAAGATMIGERVLLVVDLAAVAQRARSGTRAPERADRRPQAQRRARILVAEDSDVIREALRRELSLAGYDVTAVADGRAAIEAAARERFDALSTDVMMPHVDGYELTRALRADARHASIPIVMLTSKDARIDALRGHDAGASAYLTKPLEAGTLVRCLEGLLARRS